MPAADVPAAMRVAAIVVTYDSVRELPGCLAGLAVQTHPALEIVVVDNASTDGTRRVLAQAAADDPIRVHLNDTNRGFSGGVNDGLALLGDEVDAVLLINPDVEPPPELIERLVTTLADDPSVGSVQPTLHRPLMGPSGAPIIDSCGHVITTARLLRNRGEGEEQHGQYARRAEVFGTSGACVLHRRTMLDDVAWKHPDGTAEVLTEDLIAYFDDVELDWRARCRGWRAIHEPAVTAIHERGGAGPRRTPWVEALNWSNRLLVLVTCDQPRPRDLPLLAVTTALKTAELAITVPRAIPTALGRLRLLPAARRRRRQLLAGATTAPRVVVGRWVVPFRWGPWVRTWWRRVRGLPLEERPRPTGG